jgi:hypothetical protein
MAPTAGLSSDFQAVDARHLDVEEENLRMVRRQRV